MKIMIAFFALALAFFILPRPVHAQRAGKVYRIGLLGHGASYNYTARFKTFREELRSRGYIEGRNIRYEYRYAGGKVGRLPGLAAELVRLKVDVIVSTSTPSTRAAMKAGPAIPIVMNAGSPVETGLVASLAHPGGNVTGVTVTAGPAFRTKHLELLKEVAPSVRRVAILWDPANASMQSQLKVLQGVAPSLGMKLHPVSAGGRVNIDSILAKLKIVRADALTSFGSLISGKNGRRRMVEFTVQNRIPAAWPSRRWVRFGGLMGLGVDFVDLARRKAIFVDKILKGARPADLPIERPLKFDLIINLKTAKAMGITIPPQVLFRATEVIR